MNPTFQIDEWVASDIGLSAAAALALHERRGAQFDVSPSWTRPGHYSVVAKGVVGSVALPDSNIVVRPKVELDVAVHMLGEVLASGGRLPSLDVGTVPLGATDLTSVIASWYAQLALPVVERWLIRKYVEVAERLNTVRGRIHVPASLRTSFRSAPPQLECRFDEFTSDTLENRILRAAAVVLSGRPGLPMATAAKLRRIDAVLAEATLEIPPKWQRLSLRLDRQSQHYGDSLALADWVLERSSPELGGSSVIRPFQTFLVEMHPVFERYVFQRLRAEYGSTGFVVTPQESKPIDSRGGLFNTRPDIVVRSPEGGLVILDTKYKAFDESYVPAESDIYQMVTYCVTRGAGNGVLVYPERHPNQVARRYDITHAGVSISAFPLVLGSGPAELERSVALLARYVVSAAAPTHY